MIYIIGISISFFLVLLLFSKKAKTQADTILAWWLVFMGIHLSIYYLYYSLDYLTFPYLLGFEFPLPLVHGPFLYLYTMTLTDQPVLGRYKIIHFLPYVIGYFPLIPFLLQSPGYKISVYQGKGEGYENIILFMNGAAIFSGVLYIILSFLSIRRHQKNIANQFSTTEKINLTWLRYLIFGIAMIWIAVIIGEDKHIYALATLFVVYIGYFGIKQAGIFTHHPNANQIDSLPHKDSLQLKSVPVYAGASLQSSDEASAEKGKYQKSGLSDDEANQIHFRMKELMINEKLYLDPELTLVTLAQRLKIHPNVLSQVINSIEEKNFYDYINQQRVEEFKYLIAQPENQKYNLLGLAFQSGFNSKSAFNRNFKKNTGISPSEYLRDQKIFIQ
jgi:AraC-like DNA-binding protein